LGSVTWAGPIYVDGSAPPGGDGANWSTALRFLQDALLLATAGDEVRVAQGVYRPDRSGAFPNGTGNRETSFELRSGVTLHGGYAGLSDPNNPNVRDIALHETSLSGDLLDDDDPNFVNNDENSYHVLTATGVNNDAILDGFTITAGNADGADPDSIGGDNDGAALLNLHGSDPVLINSTFRGNRANDSGGAIYNRYENSSPTLINCVFDGNRAASGGAVMNRGGPMQLVNCVFCRNKGGDRAGAIRIYCTGNVTTLRNCTFWGNTAPVGRVLACATCSANYPSGALLVNCICWDGGSELSHDAASTVTVSYCDVQGTTPVDHNIAADPLFADPAGGDYRLAPGSPCIDAGDNAYPMRDKSDWDADGCVTDPLPVDLDGYARYVDDLATPDTGRGAAPLVDMGAYEFNSTAYLPPGPCPGDLDCDGTVGFGDINPFVQQLSNFSAWQATYPGCDPRTGDIDNDGIYGQSSFGDINPFVALLSGN
jgi:hypothetical protein